MTTRANPGSARSPRRSRDAVVRPTPPQARPEEIDFSIAGQAEVTPYPIEWEPHTHPIHELLWVRSGVMTTGIGRERYTLPRNIGIWIPAGIEHHGRVSGGAEFQASFFNPETSTFNPRVPVCVEITPLLHELLMHLSQEGLGSAQRERAEGLVFDLLAPTAIPLNLPMPEDERLRPIAEALLADPADPRSIEDWARSLGCSARTLARAFESELDQTFGSWRQHARVHAALGPLSDGVSVADAAASVGYHNASSFIAVFDRIMGTTPGRYRGVRPARNGIANE
ncbi:helix-turn-helix transcriptional regulator [Mycetocola saprophilus]|uniref:helix-turn-helix transcriptional regulator n=1 Tax=Mycetocola saprophilus TaxID=76636 RepID=UPI0004BF3453|nr:helix-turn-helix transcriptional regulator [Mycetocola saprophilus]